MLTDTHVHFDGMIEAGNILDVIVARAARSGVRHMIAVGGSPVANRAALTWDASGRPSAMTATSAPLAFALLAPLAERLASGHLLHDVVKQPLT